MMPRTDRRSIVIGISVGALVVAGLAAQEKRPPAPKPAVPAKAAPKTPAAKPPMPQISEEQYAELMKNINKTAQGMKKSLDSRLAPDAYEAGVKLETLFEQVEAFWTQRKTEDAIQWAKQAQGAAADAAFAAKSAYTSGAVIHYNKLTATCRSCHEAHREKQPDGSFRIR